MQRAGADHESARVARKTLNDFERSIVDTFFDVHFSYRRCPFRAANADVERPVSPM